MAASCPVFVMLRKSSPTIKPTILAPERDEMKVVGQHPHTRLDTCCFSLYTQQTS